MTGVMPSRPSFFAAVLSGWWCCRDCDAARIICPSCGRDLGVKRPDDHPPALPFHDGRHCPGCHAALYVSITGYRPNPTGEAPATGFPLSDPLPVAPRPQTPSRPPAPRPGPTPCPKGAKREPLWYWQTRGLTAPGQRVDGSTIAARYRRTFGCEPARDRSKTATRAYSRRELELLGVILPLQREVGR